MTLEVGKNYHGFNLNKQEKIDELNSLALIFEHEATGAEILIMENDDDNKVFSVTFKTPPENDTGVAHILEHSVLCGSRKYPVKEPFMELMKGSLKTFLNAMTFPDKTMYPVASRNKKDLFNLMSVYIDAVFFPKISKETFMQEGWHHELESADSEIIYKGVVFNEMKGVFSDPESVLDRYLNHSLFPDTTYGFESGGDPDNIPDLTYEEFKEFHKKHYHPSNSRIFLYGDGDTLEYLEFMQKNFLNEFTRQTPDSLINFQPKFLEPKREEIHYSIAKEESEENKTFITVGLVLHKSVDQEHCMAFNILSHLLLGTPASPLRKALIESGLGSEVIGGGFDDQRLETVFAVGLKGTEKENEEKILDLIFGVLKELAEKGIEKDMVKAAVNTVDFKLREANFGGFSKGIVYNIQSLGSWLYDGDPLMHLKYEEIMKTIRQKSEDGYFEGLIRDNLLSNRHRSVVVGIPKSGLTEEKDEETKKKLADYKSKLKASELELTEKETKKLQDLQLIPDPPEALATLPKLGIEDLGDAPAEFPIEEKRQNSPKVLFHDLFTNKIAYVQVGFDTKAVPVDQLQYLSLLGRLILEMGTKKSSYVEITQRMGIHTGGIRTSHFSSLRLADKNKIVSQLFFSGKAVLDKLGELFDIYRELLGEFDFSDSKQLLDIIRSAKADMEASIVPAGNQYVISRLNAYTSAIGRYDEFTGGLAYFRFLENLLERVEKDPEEVANSFSNVANLIFSQDNMLVNVTSESEDYSNFEREINSLSQVFPEKGKGEAALELPSYNLNEAFLTAGNIQYVGKGANLYDWDYKYSGKFEVLKAILNTQYLWENVRMKGGAYGCSAAFDYYSGDFALVSYRDPNLSETLSVYDEIPDFISNLDLTKDELDKFIIGCVGRLDPPLTSDRKGSISMVDSLTGMTHELRQKKREELMSTTLSDIREFAPLFQKIKESGLICVLGNEGKIKESESSFDHLVKVFN